ncbi:MAG: signal recognition particle-docking protein FtsY [Ignavibacteriae bacterium HGW-Ignavibacteriae-2]|jgi:fused signal recognition particle receptor|nr:MAG: signal recognition particle-docking protein FtsY [Ignavibacteriae bacterium HGW-Ignavibacteriae-2]
MNFLKNINLNKLKDGLSKTKQKIFNNISEVISGKAVLDETTLEEIEEILISSDVGFDTTTRIIDQAREALASDQDRSKFNIMSTIQMEMSSLLTSNSSDGGMNVDIISKFKPYVILIVGVNGAGKTTTIGKLAHNFKKFGLKVVIGSADTFRAAANEQLEVWASRAGVDIVQREHGTDPSSVAFDTLNVAKTKNADVVLIDTAGRLHTKNNLMLELQKINKVLSKVLDYAPNEVFLVVDGNTGQNAIIQAREFSKFSDITGLIITKLDGTAKGGIIFQISSELKIPVRFIGVGEQIDDLQTFEPEYFIKALFQ